jgi:IS6 family transposase
MREMYGEEFSQVTIWNWVQKYSRIVSAYVETLDLTLSGKFHHDETEIKIGGRPAWFWETIDEDTRFLVAHLLTESRRTEDAKKVFSQILRKQRPTALFTDGSFAYDDAVRKVFYTRYKAGQVEWVRRVGIRARETNNIVERLHGTLKDRLRPMRGLKQLERSRTFLGGYVAYYNFCRKHQAIGMTPAEAAGLKIKGWKQLIEAAQFQETKNEIPLEQIVEVRVRE